MIWNEQFQSKFEAFLSQKLPQSSRLADALRYAIESPGKRLRARFATEAGHLAGLPETVTEAYSFAIELVHLFSLIHDDLPCMDDDDFRRGEPTVHKKFDEATALLAGDALLSLASEAFVEIAPLVDSVSFRNAHQFFLKAIGPEGMIGGQSKELELGATATLEQLLEIQDLKTGALFRAALLVPFLLAGTKAGDAIFQEVQSYATDFGFAFQIADDLEDEAQDAKAQVKNILSLLGKDAAMEQALTRLTRMPISAKFWATGVLKNKLKA